MEGKTDGQPAHTREVKLGCVFTQTRWDRKAARGPPRGLISTSSSHTRTSGAMCPAQYPAQVDITGAGTVSVG